MDTARARLRGTRPGHARFARSARAGGPVFNCFLISMHARRATTARNVGAPRRSL